MYVIIANEEFEDVWGEVIHVGDVLETVMYDEEKDFLRYVLDKYGPGGEDIKVKWRKSKSLIKIAEEISLLDFSDVPVDNTDEACYQLAVDLYDVNDEDARKIVNIIMNKYISNID